MREGEKETKELIIYEANQLAIGVSFKLFHLLFPTS